MAISDVQSGKVNLGNELKRNVSACSLPAS